MDMQANQWLADMTIELIERLNQKGKPFHGSMAVADALYTRNTLQWTTSHIIAWGYLRSRKYSLNQDGVIMRIEERGIDKRLHSGYN